MGADGCISLFRYYPTRERVFTCVWLMGAGSGIPALLKGSLSALNGRVFLTGQERPVFPAQPLLTLSSPAAALCSALWEESQGIKIKTQVLSRFVQHPRKLPPHTCCCLSRRPSGTQRQPGTTTAVALGNTSRSASTLATASSAPT